MDSFVKGAMHMSRLLSWFLVVCICHLTVGCSTLTNTTESLLSKVGGIFDGHKADETDAARNPMVCLLTPPDPATLQTANVHPGSGDDSTCIQVPQTSHDFGPIKDDAVLVHEFKIMNRCNTELKIKSVKPG